MTEDGETPDAGEDRDEEERAPAAEGDEATPTAEDGGDAEGPVSDPEEPVRGQKGPDRDGGPEAAGEEPAETASQSGDGASGPDAGSDRSESPGPSGGNESDPSRRGERSRPGEGSDEDAGDDQEEPPAGFGTERDRGGRQEGDGERDRQELDVDAADGSSDPGASVDTSDREARDESTAVDEGEALGDPRDYQSGSEAVQAGDAGEVAGEFDDGDAPGAAGDSAMAAEPDVPEDVRSYDRFQKVDRASYDRVNEFLRDRTYVTAREWAIARLCADFRTATGVEMTKIGENLPHLVPFMTDTYSPQAVNQARSAFEDKVRKSGATFLYGAMSGFFTADELDEIMYEVTEVAKFLLEVEGVDLTVDEELDAEDRISAVMREVRQASEELRYDEVACPHCGEAFQPAEE